MKPALKVLGAVCSTSLLFGCASLPKEMQMTVVPALKVRHSFETADAYYAVGRYHHGSRRFDNALKAYQQALEIDSGHTKARSALGILYAERGNYPDAIAALRKVADANPHNGHHFSNLGYAYMLNGQYKDAEHALEKATSLDPNNLRAWRNLASLMEKLNRMDRAKQIFTHVQSIQAAQSSGKLASAPENSPVAKLNATVPTATVGPSPLQAIPSRVSSVTADAQEKIRKVAPGIYEIRHGSASSISVASTLKISPGTSGNEGKVQFIQRPAYSKTTSKSWRDVHCKRPSPLWQDQADISNRTGNETMPLAIQIEISNGNGITGMARSLGETICGRELEIVRLTNYGTFHLKTTRIEYSASNEKLAHTLAKYLGHPTLLKMQKYPSGADIRIVLGKDISNTASLVSRFPANMGLTQTETNPKS